MAWSHSWINISPLSMGFLITLKGLSDASKAHSNASTPKTIESCQLASAFTDNARGIKSYHQRSKRSQCKQQNPKSVSGSKRRRGWVWTWLVATPRVGLMSRDSPHKAFALCDITTHWALSCPKLWLCIASATLTLALCFQSFCGLGTHTSNTDAALAGVFAREKAIKEDRSTH